MTNKWIHAQIAGAAALFLSGLFLLNWSLKSIYDEAHGPFSVGQSVQQKMSGKRGVVVDTLGWPDDAKVVVEFDGEDASAVYEATLKPTN